MYSEVLNKSDVASFLISLDLAWINGRKTPEIFTFMSNEKITKMLLHRPEELLTTSKHGAKLRRFYVRIAQRVRFIEKGAPTRCIDPT